MLRLASHKLPRSGLATNRWATTSRPWQVFRLLSLTGYYEQRLNCNSIRFAPLIQSTLAHNFFASFCYLQLPLKQFLTPPARDEQILLGCVAYDPSVGTIWDSMKSYFQVLEARVYDIHTTYSNFQL